MNKYICNISETRTELMGIGILFVLIMHLVLDNSFYAIISARLPSVCYLVLTPGFLFLSGFGLTRSMENGLSIINFYKRRFIKIFLPFIIITLPLTTFHILHEGGSVFDIIVRVTALVYWTEGINYCGTWYMSVLLMLYLIFPIAYKIAKGRNWAILLFVFMGMVPYGLAQKCNTFDENTIFLAGIPAFFIGMFVMNNIKNMRFDYSMFTILLILLYFLLRVCSGSIGNYSIVLEKTIHILILSQILFLLNNRIRSVLQYLGTHSLEIYLLHTFLYTCIFVVFPKCDYTMLFAELIALALCKPIKRMIGVIIQQK